MERYNWAAISEEKMNPLLSRRVIHTGQMTIARMWLGKGAVVPLHQHVNQQVTMLKSGALEFEMGGERFVLKAGRCAGDSAQYAASRRGDRGIDGDGFIHARAGRLDSRRRCLSEEIVA